MDVHASDDCLKAPGLPSSTNTRRCGGSGMVYVLLDEPFIPLVSCIQR